MLLDTIKKIKYAPQNDIMLYEKYFDENEVFKDSFITGCMLRLLKIIIENYDAEYKGDVIEIIKYYDLLDGADIIEFKGHHKFINSKIALIEMKRLLLSYE